MLKAVLDCRGYYHSLTTAIYFCRSSALHPLSEARITAAHQGLVIIICGTIKLTRMFIIEYLLSCMGAWLDSFEFNHCVYKFT